MQIAWFEKQNWLEIRNAQPDISLFDGQSFHPRSAMYSKNRHHIYLLDEDTSIGAHS